MVMKTNFDIFHRIWSAIILVFGRLLICTSIVLVIIAVYPFEVIVIKCPVEVITPHVSQGSYVILNIDYDKKVDVPTILSVQLIVEYPETGNIIFLEPVFSSNLEPGKHKAKVGFPLPTRIHITDTSLKTIQASLKITNVHEVWGFRNINTTSYSEKFTIDLGSGL